MGRPPVKSAEDKTRIVLAVLRGEVSNASTARREGVPVEGGGAVSARRRVHVASRALSMGNT